MELIDTHCHLNDPRLEADLPEVLARARQAGVKVMIVVGYDLASSAKAVALAEREKDLYATVGVHPHDAAKVPPDYLERLRSWAKTGKVVAVGEIGLDFYRNLSPPARQREVFLAQLHLARELSLPVVIHCRDAYDELYSLLKGEKSELEGVLHCFSGTWREAERFLALGFYLSFAGTITFPRSDSLAEVVARMELERLLLETDAPYLAPVPHRGKRNEPAYLVHIARKVAEIRGMRVEEVAAASAASARRLFGLKEGELDG
ncbi:hydrolase, TatD family [Ammonifex degensii KC4]|uniref:Hydrolase, TatD family n=1 Tax=Ammonifex degensii (strain DSM 10501 / KC4) TaxID=429009 RepID=C9RA62_AMMDK|nr:TatD family hydrolase [Ammonifex degensii]ACX53191.1 hydrolase, TatD family [Ammonifex degensii KC4]